MFPGEKDYIETRKDLERKLKKNKSEVKRAKELWEVIKDLTYDDLTILSGVMIEHMKPMVDARQKVLDSPGKRKARSGIPL